MYIKFLQNICPSFGIEIKLTYTDENTEAQKLNCKSKVSALIGEEIVTWDLEKDCVKKAMFIGLQQMLVIWPSSISSMMHFPHEIYEQKKTSRKKSFCTRSIF